MHARVRMPSGKPRTTRTLITARRRNQAVHYRRCRQAQMRPGQGNGQLPGVRGKVSGQWATGQPASRAMPGQGKGRWARQATAKARQGKARQGKAAVGQNPGKQKVASHDWIKKKRWLELLLLTRMVDLGSWCPVWPVKRMRC